MGMPLVKSLEKIVKVISPTITLLLFLYSPSSYKYIYIIVSSGFNSYWK